VRAIVAACISAALPAAPLMASDAAPQRGRAAAAPQAAPKPPAAPAPALQQPAASPLLLSEVLASSVQYQPQILEALVKVRVAEGKALSARGAFDTVFDGELFNRPFGFYDGTYAEARATRPLENNNGGLYGGYRISGGKFPIYEDKYYTNQAGDLFIGGYYNLLRDRFIDSRRATLAQAEADIAIADFDRQMVAIGVQRRAIAAYQAWVAAGLRVAAYRQLVALAEERQQGIETQIRLGQRADIVGAENLQNIVRRQALLVRATQELASAANDLSFFYRDADGNPVQPGPDRLPQSFPDFQVAMLTPAQARAVERPDLDAIEARILQQSTRLELARNDLRPRLELRGEAAQSLGAVGEGGPSRDGARGYVGLRFSVPLQQRSARGRIAEAEAEIQGLRLRRRITEDQIMTEVNGLVLQVGAQEQLRTLAASEAGLAQQLAEAERKRFRLGVSDLLLVNIREEAAADARLRQIDIEFRRAQARAELAAASVDRKQLGLPDS